ncbi:MAG: cohesin domain-containing protein, partial [Candidatus Bathyarchaeia archaeon]
MKKHIKSLAVVAILLTSLMLLPIPSKAADRPLLKVEPQTLSFRTDLNPVGYNFTVSIIIENVPEPGFYGWELVLSWTPGVINCVEETLNFKLWMDPATGKYYYNGPWVTEPIDNEAGTYWQSLTGKAPAEPSTGTFWLVNLTFQIVKPPPYGGEVFTMLHLAPKPPANYCIADKTAREIPHDFQDGEYHYFWAPPQVVPYLAVYQDSKIPYGSSYKASSIGEVFDIKILIKGVDAGWWLAGVQFILTYNTSILDALDVTKGDFFEPYTTTTWFYERIFEDMGKIRVAYIIFDIPSYTTPAEGSGLIATIRFNATAQGEFPVVLSCDLLLKVDVEAGCQSFFANKFAGEIPYGTPEQGYYEIIPKVKGR